MDYQKAPRHPAYQRRPSFAGMLYWGVTIATALIAIVATGDVRAQPVSSEGASAADTAPVPGAWQGSRLMTRMTLIKPLIMRDVPPGSAQKDAGTWREASADTPER